MSKRHLIAFRLTLNEWLTLLVGLGSLVVGYLGYLNALDTTDIKKAVGNLSTLATQTKRQADITQDQLDEIRKSFATDRAYIYEDRFARVTKGPMVPNLKVRLEFWNFGKTPAILRSVASKCSYFLSPPPPIIDDDWGALQFQLGIEAGTSAGVYPNAFKATKEQIEAARNGIGSLRCVYNARYADVRWQEHIAGFCVVYNFNVRAFLYCPEAIYRDTYKKTN